MNLRKRNKHRKGPEKKQKKGIKTKSQDGKAEVFVLPPDLLQKLGINLGSVQSSLECSTNNGRKNGDINSNHVPVMSYNDKEPDNTSDPPKGETKSDTTILETANLMKSSVFLSPTFVTTDNIVPGELEISNIIAKKEATQRDIVDDMPMHVTIDEHIPQNEKFAVIKNTQEMTTVTSNKQYFLNSDDDVETTLQDPTVTETQFFVNKTLPQTEKMSVILNVEQQDFKMDITNKQNSLNPDSGTEILNSADGNSVSFLTQELMVNSKTISNMAEKNVIKEAGHKIEIQIDELSAISKPKFTTDIGNKCNVSNLYSDIEILNSSDGNVISQVIVNNYPVTKMPEKCTRGKSTDDHSDEAYLSDCSNRTTSPSNTTGCLPNIPDVYGFNMPTESQNKVKILSEEILSPSKLKNIQIMLSPNRTSFIPISMNCILEKNKMNANTQNCFNTINNVINTFGSSPPRDDNGKLYQDKNKNMDLLALYDEQGNSIPVIRNLNNIEITTDAKIEDLSQTTEETITESDTSPETHAQINHTFGDIDLVVIGMDIEENEDILENFVHEITSNDDNNILEKIEQSEKYCSPVKPHKSVVPQKVTSTKFENTCVNQKKYENNKLTELNATGVSFNKLNQSDDKDSQILVMATNRNNNTIKPNQNVKNNELNDVQSNKSISLESEVGKESKVTKRNTLDRFSETLPYVEQTETELDLNYINPMPFASHILENQNESDRTPTNEFSNNCISYLKILVNNNKHIENTDITNSKINTGLETSDEPTSSNTANLIFYDADNKLSIVESNSKEIEINTMDKEHTGKEDKTKQIASEKERVETIDKTIGIASEQEHIDTIDQGKEIAPEQPEQGHVEKTDKGREIASQKEHIGKNYKRNESAVEKLHTEKIYSGKPISSDKEHTEKISKGKITTSEKEYTEKTYKEKEIASNNVHTDNENKVIQIATYLSQFAKIHSEASKLKRKCMANIKIPAKRSKHNALTSKKYIQGVEKPGGSDNSAEYFKVNYVEKTYARLDKSRKETSRLSRPLIATPAKESQNMSISCYELEDCNDSIQKSYKSPEFCLCQDFGTLAFYDSDYPYEHIHFWEHKLIDCDRESVFSIWNESDTSDFNVDPKIVETVEFPEECERNSIAHVDDSICWHSCKKIAFPKQSSEIDSALKVITKTKESIPNYDKTTSEAVAELEVESTSLAVSKQSDLPDLGTPKKSLYHVEKDLVQATLEVNEIASPEKTSTPSAASKHNTKGNVKDLKAYKKKLKEKITRKIKAANLFDSSKIKMESDDTEKCTNVLRKVDRVSVRSIDKLIFEDESNNTQESEHVKSGTGNTPEEITAVRSATIERQKRRKATKIVHEDDEPATKKIVKCNDETADITQPVNKDNSEQQTVPTGSASSSEDFWMCGVCDMSVIPSDWMEHIRIHDYLAWRVGDTPLNLDNEDNVRIHLINLTKMYGDLKCSTCGISRRYPKAYLLHKEKCTGRKKPNQEESVDDLPLADLKRKKRKLAEEDVKTKVECGVCKKSVADAAWINHMYQNHEYLAWKAGDPPLDLNNEEQVRTHLFEVVRTTGGLTCSKCGIVRKYPKTYMQHVQQCTGKDVSQDESLNTSVEVVPRNPSDQVKCAVCGKYMQEKDWHQHILDEHQYMAWRDGDKPLNLEDPEAIKSFLYNICKETGNLTCNKCGLARKYVKVYLHHIESCTGPAPETTLNDESAASVKEETNYLAVLDMADLVTCAVCHKEVSSAKWIQHIARAHNYMAHHTSQTIDLNDQEVVHNYLYEILKRAGHLTCSKCGLMRKYVKTFIQHINICNVESTTGSHHSDSEHQETDGMLVCAVCSEELTPKQWKSHKMDKHYNIAWTIGSVPLDIKNPYVVDALMKEYVEKYKKMVCKVCKLTRVSRIGFYAHVIQCGKTEEEIDAQKTTCAICNKKYLYVYHNQHMTWHNQQDLNVQRKLKMAEEQEQKLKEEKAAKALIEDGTPGRRKAAQKAKNVIENLKTENFTIKCPNCKFGGDSKEELLNHVCKKGNDDEENFSDSGESAKVDDYSGAEEDEESEDDMLNTDLSDEDIDSDPKKKKKSLAYNHTRRYPFIPKDLNLFLKKAGSEFLRHHYNDNILFPNLRVFDCEPIPSDELHKYLPPLEESCKFKFGNEDWNTYRRFQVEMKMFSSNKSVSMSYQCMFTGGYIQCVAWSQLSPDKVNVGGNFLAVACHQGADIIRLEKHETPAGPGLIQLWSFGDFSQQAELSLGIGHDYGAAWAMDWCPYGARDLFPAEGAAGNALRLGLLAVAFSSGTVAVFAIPYPASLVKRDKVIQKLKPVVELRQTMHPERKIYQATSICWSKQKPYESIVVGYGDGTTAYFDLNTESPFLKTMERGVLVLYPYHDERVLNKCITGLDLYPTMDGAGPGGAACFTSGAGVVLKSRPGVRPARQYISSAMGAAKFEPLWPSAVLVGDEGNLPTAVNEIEWYGGGRRMGGGSAGAGCQRCGRFVFAASPLLMLRCPHPADNTAGKQVAAILRMTPFAKKRKKLANDELQTIIEPTTYEDAVRQYGIELRMDKESLGRAAKQHRETYPERCPERFPLGEVTSMAFCPDPQHHKKLAVATHAGMIFLIQI
ncbi:hypothetical protein O0L34_g1126 [Tuta absoluta]|nr:hypothetical protein O0L34_g1126 [Tuta absoluta]